MSNKPENNIRYGILHNHTDASIRDSGMSVKTLVTTAKNLGAPAIALTDHGNMANIFKFYDTCKEEDVKPILGCEAYYGKDAEHMILMAKDYDGYKAIMKAVSEANEFVDQFDRPLMNDDIIDRNFRNGAGHGHVIATSACISGIVASMFFKAEKFNVKIEKLKEKQKGLESPSSKGFLKNMEDLANCQEQKKTLTKEISELNKIISKPVTKILKNIEKAQTEDEKAEAQKAYDEIVAAKEKAQEEISEKTKERETVEARIATLRPIVNTMKHDAERWSKIQSDIDAIEEEKLQLSDPETEARERIAKFNEIFGDGNFFVELQYHYMKEEKEVMPVLATIAKDMGIPTVLANDAHIPDKSDDSVLQRSILRATRFLKWENPTRSEKEMYIKTDKELVDTISKIVPEEIVMEAYENIGKIVDLCNVEMTKENHYPKFTPPDGTDAETYFRRRINEGVKTRFPEGLTEEYQKRLDYEISVIVKMGYVDYHLIVQDFLRYARCAGKLDLTDQNEIALARTFDTERIEKYVENRAGEYIGPGRGSAAGSLVCYVLGITNLDPIRYNLLFERFLNPERVSMPDIDVDIESEVRGYVVEYVKHKYGEKSVSGIMTKGTQKGKAAILTAARIYGLETAGSTTAYLDLKDDIVNKATEISTSDIEISLDEVMKDYESVDANGNKVHVKGLLSLYAGNKTALDIIHYAKLIEGVTTQFGQHAAGIIITDGKPVSDYVPLIYNKVNNIMTTQCDMVQCESLGLLKMDFLGLNNLTIISETLKEIQRATGKLIDMDKIPFESEVFKEIYSKALTNSVFQFESNGMKKMLKGFKPDCIDDIVLLVAMFRPGPLQYLSDVIEVKNGRKPLTFLIPELEPILKNTYGSITYQEQVQEIFKSLAGYSLGQADLVRRAMSKKKEKVLKAEREAFINGDESRQIKGCVANGIDKDKANILFDQMMDFASYAFNKSHAACYSITSYQTAWLKYHYPIYYMRAVLNHSPFDKVPGLLDDLKVMNVKILPPNVNKSELDFSIKDDAIVFGIGSIKGLGKSASEMIEERNKNGEYKSFSDFVIRTLPTKTLLENMTVSGAFDSFCNNREAVYSELPEILKNLKKYKDYLKKIETETDDKKLEKYKAKRDEIVNAINSISFDENIMEDNFARLEKEAEALGTYVSAHPLDLYPESSQLGANKIREISDDMDSVTILALVTGLAIRKVKKTGKEMGVMKLSDQTGSINALCFSKQYERCKALLKDNAVFKIEANILRDEKSEEIKLSVESIETIEIVKPTIILEVSDIAEWHEKIRNKAVIMSSKNGNPLKIYDRMMDEIRDTNLFVATSILEDKNFKTYLANE